MKALIKKLFFNTGNTHKILSGPGKGIVMNYDINNRFQHLLGSYEREIYSYLSNGMRKSNVLIDVGANDGYYVMAFLKTGKQVIACEPGPMNKEIIKNAALNGFKEGEHFFLEKRLVGEKKDEQYVTIEELTNGMGNALFFLIDIDGGEFELLSSCGDNFNYQNSIWLIETHSKELEDSCMSFLKERGFAVEIINNKWWRFLLPEQRPLAHNRWLYAEFKNI